MDNHVENLCITACITYADIHTIGVRGVQGGISTEKLDSFQQVFHTFIWSKDINLARYTQMVYNYIYCCHSAD